MNKLINLKSKKLRKCAISALFFALVLSGGFYYIKNSTERRVATGGEVFEEPKMAEKAKPEEDPVVDDNPVIPEGVSPDSIKSYELITENELYKIRKLGGTYTVTLYAIINRPDQAQSYRDQLKEYKSYALEYLEGQGIEINTVRAFKL